MLVRDAVGRGRGKEKGSRKRRVTRDKNGME